eukprot:m.205553 g.205553  ORF g.205553 m.205553 type:complete len:80 (-) comp22994_c0_seq1:1412-1651(-)
MVGALRGGGHGGGCLIVDSKHNECADTTCERCWWCSQRRHMSYSHYTNSRAHNQHTHAQLATEYMHTHTHTTTILTLGL